MRVDIKKLRSKHTRHLAATAIRNDDLDALLDELVAARKVVKAATLIQVCGQGVGFQHLITAIATYDAVCGEEKTR